MSGNAVRGLKPAHTVISMLMLYAGKASAIVVNLVFLPIYSLVLGPEGFGVVAIILSLQALLLMLDLGMSTIVGRDIAASEHSSRELLWQIFSAELALILLYGALLLVTTVLALTGFRFGLDPATPVALVILFMLLVLQNLRYSAMIARRAYIAASALQLVGNLVRAGGTALVLVYLSPTLTAFVVSQLVGALLQFVVARYLCILEFNRHPEFAAPDDSYADHADYVRGEPLSRSMLDLIKRAKPMALLSVAGAAVTQLDKPIISFFMTPASVAPYFLAMTYCMVPMAVLAAPVAQFFQPRVINAVSAGDVKHASQVLRIFTLAILLVTIPPSVLMYLYSDFLVGEWLRQGPLVGSTLVYVQVLLPGLVLGALGYVPYSLLLVTRDYKFMATLSTVMTVVTLTAATFAASGQSVWLVCFVYASYHAASTVLQWIRALNLPRVREVAYSSAKLTVLTLFAMIFVVLSVLSS